MTADQKALARIQKARHALKAEQRIDELLPRLREVLAAAQEIPEAPQQQVIISLEAVIDFIERHPEMEGMSAPLKEVALALGETAEGRKHHLLKPVEDWPASGSRESGARQMVRALSAVLVTALNKLSPPDKMSIDAASLHVAKLLANLGYKTDRSGRDNPPPSKHAVRHWRDAAMAGGDSNLAYHYKEWLTFITDPNQPQPLTVIVKQLTEEALPEAVVRSKKT